MNPSAANRPGGSLDLATALEPYSGPWDARRAAHLLRRSGFGGSPADVERIARASVHSAVDALVHFPTDFGQDDRPSGLPDLREYARLVRGLRTGRISSQSVIDMDGSPTMQPAAVMSPTPQDGAATQTGDATIGRAFIALQRRYLRPATIGVQLWWLNRMLTSTAPLQEKMVLFWHGHFTSQVLAKATTPQQMFAQNQLFRRYALGNVRELTQAVARDPAMLKYLDNARNVKAHPNENFARELMELFTLGIGNYTEQDVRESARAFTGWTVRGNEFVADRAQHDDGRKTFLGRSGNFDGGDVIDIIFQQPAAARWFARKLLAYFVYDDPEPELVDATAALFRKSNFELAPVLSTVLRSNVFFSDRAYRALVKSPVEFVIGTYKLYGVTEVAPQTVVALRRMGQVPLSPPSVKGWDGGISWINSQTLLTRENFAAALVASPAMPQDSWLASEMPSDAGAVAQRLVSAVLQGDASSAAVARLVGYLSGDGTTINGALSGENFPERIRGAAYLAMATPAYQLN